MNEKIKAYLDSLSKAYYSGNPLVSDETFDALAEYHEYNAVGECVDNEETALIIRNYLAYKNTIRIQIIKIL